MKIAVCYSGQYRTYDGWLENHKKSLPENCDYYYSTWTSEKDKIDRNLDFTLFDPVNVKYNLYEGEFARIYGTHIKNKRSEIKRHYTATQQHIGHFLIQDKIKDLNYDVIIRMRYDTFLGNHDWMTLINKVYKTGIAIGIGNTNQADDNNKEMHLHSPVELNDGKNLKYMLDFINIHQHNKILNVLELNNKKLLWPTNAGWYQILSQSLNGHENYKGGVQLARYIGKKII